MLTEFGHGRADLCPDLVEMDSKLVEFGTSVAKLGPLFRAPPVRGLALGPMRGRPRPEGCTCSHAQGPTDRAISTLRVGVAVVVGVPWRKGTPSLAAALA